MGRRARQSHWACGRDPRRSARSRHGSLGRVRSAGCPCWQWLSPVRGGRWTWPGTARPDRATQFSGSHARPRDRDYPGCRARRRRASWANRGPPAPSRAAVRRDAWRPPRPPWPSTGANAGGRLRARCRSPGLVDLAAHRRHATRGARLPCPCPHVECRRRRQ